MQYLWTMTFLSNLASMLTSSKLELRAQKHPHPDIQLLKQKNPLDEKETEVSILFDQPYVISTG